VLAVALALSALPSACSKSAAPTPSEGSAQPAPIAAPSAANPRPSPPASAAAAVSLGNGEDPAPTAAAPCRALRVTGDVRTDDGKAIATQSDLDGAHWLELGKASELVVRHAVSAREMSLFGPGRAFPCRFGQEQVLLAEGKFESSQGTGVRPGAEVWIATPFGSVRYADADLQLTTRREGLELAVRGGQAFAESMDGLRGARDGQIAGPKGRATVRGAPDAEAAVRACERAADAAADSAKLLLQAKPAELGELAAAQLRTRRVARGRCLAAETSVAGLSDPATKSRLGDLVQRAATRWQGVPTQPVGSRTKGP
jgi:hypothetical protein